MQLLILTLLVAAASATYSSYGSYGNYGYPYYSNYGGYGGSLYGHSYGGYGGALNYDLGGYGAGSYSYQPARIYTNRNPYSGYYFPTGPAQISFVMGTSTYKINPPQDRTTQKTVHTPDFSTKQTNVQTNIDDSSEDANYDDNFFGTDGNSDDFESVFEEKPTIDRTSQQPSKTGQQPTRSGQQPTRTGQQPTRTGLPKNRDHSSSHDSSSHDSRHTKTQISHESVTTSSDHGKKPTSAKSPTSKGYFPSYPSLYSQDDSSSPFHSSNDESAFPFDESKVDRADKSTLPEKYTADMTYSTLKGQKNNSPSNTFVEVPEHNSEDFNTASNTNDKQFPNQQRVTEQKQSNSKSPVYEFPTRQTRHKSASYEHFSPVVPVLTAESPIIYDQGFDIPVEYVI